MALEMKKSSRWWYARIMVNGKLLRFHLDIKIGGKRPPSLIKVANWHDAAFQRSYGQAKEKHDALLKRELSKKHVEETAQRIIEAKTGTRLDFVKVAAVPEAWATLPRKRPPCPQYAGTAKKKLRQFADFIRQNYPEAEDLAAVQSKHVQVFLDNEAKRGISPRTWNITLKLLKTVFRRLEPNADAYRNFLKDVSEKDEDTIHREPFKDDEIEAILAVAQDDEIMRGPIVTALCTAMRRGDCAQLKWESVDLGAGFIEVRTSKTGETAEIPILPALREELSRTPRGTSEYVFPEAAAMYKKTPDGLNWRLRDIFIKAGFVDVEMAERIKARENEKPAQKLKLPELPPDELSRRGLEAIAAGEMIDAKRERMKAIFTAYISGKGLPTIARELGVSKGTVSLHLHKLEDMIGAAVLRRPVPQFMPSVIRGAIHAEDGKVQRLNRGSIRGWHSFRTSFVTRALAAGMPEELVRRVTGHTAVALVRKHYFKPGREEFRREFEKAMPRMLMNGAKSRDEQLREIIEGMTPKTLKKDKAWALALLNGTEKKQ